MTQPTPEVMRLRDAVLKADNEQRRVMGLPPQELRVSVRTADGPDIYTLLLRQYQLEAELRQFKWMTLIAVILVSLSLTIHVYA